MTHKAEKVGFIDTEFGGSWVRIDVVELVEEVDNESEDCDE